MAMVTRLRKFCALNANISIRAKATNFKFGMHAPRVSPSIPLKKIRTGGRGQGHVTPEIFRR